MYLRLVTTCRGNLKFLLSHFDLSTAKLCIKIKGGGRVKISDFAVGKSEQVKFKFFAMLINFKACCFRGGETISKQP